MSRWVRLCLVAAVAACSSPAKPPPVAPPSPMPAPSAEAPTTALERVADAFIAEYLKESPVDATLQGEHRYDGTWPDLTTQGRARMHAFVDHTRAELAAIPREQLDQQHQIDASILDTQLRRMIFELDQEKGPESDPGFWTDLIGQGFDPLVNRNFGTPATRLRALISRLDGIPALLALAKQQLAHPPKVMTETAIVQAAGLVDLVDKDIAPRFADALAASPDDKVALAAASQRAGAALHDFHDFLAKDLLPRSDGSFRAGRDKFATKLALTLDDDHLDIDALAQAARDTLAQTRAEMVETGKQIWAEDKLGKLPPLDTPARQNAFVKQMLDHVAKDRPTNKTIVADAKVWLDKATAFVREHDLVGVPDEPVAVIEMPEYRRGVAVAYCDSSGPFEAKPETFFTISPTPADWDAKRVASFYREYNHSMLADLSIHEAMPGHYLQLMHNNQNKGSKLRALFGNGAFVEGWAVYGEWLMAEHGFGGPKVKLERQKMILRVAANAVLDHDIHAGQMEEKDAIALMTGEAFQEDGEATGKWRRARLSSAQLSTYFYGFTELYKLRKSLEGQPGFSERAYHDKLLSFGSPAIKYIRQLMMPKG